MLLKSEDGLGLGYISIVVLVRESFWLLRNWNGKGPLTYDQDKISHRQSTKHRFYEKIITTKEVVQTKMLTEKEEGEEQKKGEKKSELTGTVAILFYWGLPSHVLLRVCKFPLSCLLLHLEPRCKRRDLTAQCHPTALPAGTQQATHHPKFIAILPMQLCVQPFLHIWPDEAMVNSFDSAGTIPKSRKRLGPIPI